MNLNLQEGLALAGELKEALAADKPNCDVVICTPFIHLAKVADVVEGTVIGLGAENCADKEKLQVYDRQQDSYRHEHTHSALFI